MSMQADLMNPELGYSDEGLQLADPAVYEDASKPFGLATRLPPVAYRSKVFSELENEKIWTRSWVVIGLLQQIPNPGDLLPFTLGFHGIHVQRNRDGTISARMNRHQHGACRFVPVQCRTGTQTKCSITSCNYTRDADAMPAGPDGENSDEMYKFVGLVPEKLSTVKCETWGPFIFINLDPACGPLSDQIGNLMPRLSGVFDGKLAIRAKLWLDFKCNWKTMGASFMETAIPAPGDGDDDGGATFAEGLGGPHWINAGQALTPLSALVAERGLKLFWIFPNVLLAAGPTHVTVILLQATSMGKTLCRFYLLTNADEIGSEADASAGRFAYDWISILKAIGTSAEAMHDDAILHGTPSRPETVAGDLPVETNFASYMLNRFAIRRICTEHHYYWTAPIMDAAALMRGVR